MNKESVPQTDDFCNDLENWMQNLPLELKTLPINLLSIPGSHDSMTYSITNSSQISPDAEYILQLLRWSGPVLRYFMARWAKTQSLNFTQQLRIGIRYFDLRVATKEASIHPYFVHGLYASDVPTMLMQLRNFLNEHPQEVILLDFQHFFNFDNYHHRNLINLILTSLERKLTPYKIPMKDLTLEFMNKYEYQVLLIYRTNFSHLEHPLLWPASSFPTPWPQTVLKSELIKKLDKGICTRSYLKGYVSQCVLTPTSWFVTKHLFGNLKAECVTPSHKTIMKWVRNQKSGIGGVNIVITDFVDLYENEFTREVIGLNRLCSSCDMKNKATYTLWTKIIRKSSKNFQKFRRQFNAKQIRILLNTSKFYVFMCEIKSHPAFPESASAQVLIRLKRIGTSENCHFNW